MHFPSPKELKQELPINASIRSFIAESRYAAQKIVSGEDQRLAILVGPCSVHEVEGTIEYAEKLADLAERVRESCFLVMRVCVEKPRTGLGWKGMLYDPHLNGSHQIQAGIRQSRRILLDLAKRGVATVMEFVDPLASSYFDDLLVWGLVGARTSSSQPHRQLASSLSFPVGFKNGLDGEIEPIINSLQSAASPHTFLHVNQDGQLSPIESQGNPFAHLILRGSIREPNYDASFIEYASKRLALQNLPTRLMVDCAHGNCQKDYLRQKEAFLEVLRQIEEGNETIMGLMLESYLHAGNQSLSEGELSLKSGLSITDPCLDWSSTEELILSASKLLEISSSDSGSGRRP